MIFRALYKYILLAILPILFVVSSFVQIENNNQLNSSIPVMGVPPQKVVTETRFSESVKDVEQKISFETKYIDDPKLEIGIEAISQEGRNGQKKVITTIIYYDSEEYERKVEEKIIEEPVDRVIARGTKVVPKTLDTEYGGLTYIRKFSDVWATSYDSTCPGCSETTAIGMKQGYGVVAVDPELIPLRSKLYIPGYGIAIAGDVGGSIKGKRIDLGFDSLNGQWKARYVDVYLLTD